MRYLFVLIQLTWGLIQTLLGLFIFIINLKSKHFIYKGSVITRWKYRSCLSLGLFVFIGSDKKDILRHEYGHYLQSLILGPLYLLIIGIPSLIWAMVYKRYTNDYYSFYTERWANELYKKLDSSSLNHL